MAFETKAGARYPINRQDLISYPLLNYKGRVMGALVAYSN
jgi:hypothetical protein